MAARKPHSLSSRHSTKAEISARTESEAAMTPTTELTVTPPPELRGHKPAAAAWKRLIKLYDETEGTIVTAFDADLLAKYCLLEEECMTLEEIRDEQLTDLDGVKKRLSKMGKPKIDDIKEYIALLEQKNALLGRYQGLDARLDGKRKLLHALAQSLYLTPRSRAGVDPKRKGEEPTDPLKEFD